MSRIKECFISRWKNNGKIVECDLSQIEVVMLAYQSQDPQMIQDVIDGVDFHCKALAFRMGEKYEDVIKWVKKDKDPKWIALRKRVKAIRFCKQYGGGAEKISKDTGIPINEVREFIRAEEELYPNVVLLHEQWIEEVERNKYLSNKRTPNGMPAKESFYTSITGQRYGFVEQDTPKNMQLFAGYKEALIHDPNLSYGRYKLYGKPKTTGFKPTQIKNYQTQGDSGIIIQLILGELFDVLIHNENLFENCLLINTVHDSVLFDCKSSVLSEAIELITNTFENSPVLFENAFGSKFNLPIRCEIEVGDSWGTKQKY